VQTLTPSRLMLQISSVSGVDDEVPAVGRPGMGSAEIGKTGMGKAWGEALAEAARG